MGFLQKVGNALARFMYGRNGADHLGLTTIWTAVVLSIINAFVHQAVVASLLNLLTTVLMFWALFRMFSRNLPKRRAENAAFLEKVWWPVKRRFNTARQQKQDKDHKYFTCPNCGAVCRVPRGKGKIVITCPKCRGEIHGKT